MAATDTPCERFFDRAGLPGRTDLILARERGGFDSMLDVLRQMGKGTRDETLPLTVRELEDGLRASDASVQYAAVFLAGRCRAPRQTNARITAELRTIVDSPTPSPDVAIEAAMSLVLRGERERGHQYLLRAVVNPDPFADAYKAGFFLAQLGDPSGWPVMVRATSSDIGHFRLMALRHIAGFLPYEGQTVGGIAVDVHTRLCAALSDSDALVRQEMPFYLEEIRQPGLRELLAPVASGDSDVSVRTAAEMVMNRLPQ